MLFAKHLSFDKRFLVATGFVVASAALVLLGFDRIVSGYLLTLGLLGACLAGAFYTFGSTTPFAMVVVFELMRAENALVVAAVAAATAATVDAFLFSAMRDTLEANARKLVYRIRWQCRKFKLVLPAAGLFVFAMPFPDEIALAFLEMTDIKIARLWLAVFAAKFAMLVMLWWALSR
ncbi:MAG: hypothetical protein WC607_02270 [Candidatus Micrarchaeia archaeon]